MGHVLPAPQPYALRRRQTQALAVCGGDSQGADVVRRQLGQLGQPGHVIDAHAQRPVHPGGGEIHGIRLALRLDVLSLVGLRPQPVGAGIALGVRQTDVALGVRKPELGQIIGMGERRQGGVALHRGQQLRHNGLLQREIPVVAPVPRILLPHEPQRHRPVVAHQLRRLLGGSPAVRTGSGCIRGGVTLLFAAAHRQRSDHYQRQQQCSCSPYIHHKKSPFVFLEVPVIILLYQT